MSGDLYLFAIIAVPCPRLVNADQVVNFKLVTPISNTVLLSGRFCY